MNKLWYHRCDPRIYSNRSPQCLRVSNRTHEHAFAEALDCLSFPCCNRNLIQHAMSAAHLRTINHPCWAVIRWSESAVFFWHLIHNQYVFRTPSSWLLVISKHSRPDTLCLCLHCFTQLVFTIVLCRQRPQDWKLQSNNEHHCFHWEVTCSHSCNR